MTGFNLKRAVVLVFMAAIAVSVCTFGSFYVIGMLTNHYQNDHSIVGELQSAGHMLQWTIMGCAVLGALVAGSIFVIAVEVYRIRKILESQVSVDEDEEDGVDEEVS